jgi:hypothetical protein
VKIIRWTARVWSILVAASILLMFFLPGSGGGAIASVDKFLLALTGMAVLGLFVAWRWEFAGGIFTIAIMFVREIAWVILKGNWMVAFLFLWALIVPPAILFLIAWNLGWKSKASPNAAG